MGAAFDFLFQLLLLSAGCVVELVLIKVASRKAKPVLAACLVGGSALIVLGVKSALIFESWSDLSAGGIANAQLLVSVSACAIGLWGVVIALRRLA